MKKDQSRFNKVVLVVYKRIKNIAISSEEFYYSCCQYISNGEMN